MAASQGADIINDIIATNIPSEVIRPHGRNSFALDDGIATNDTTFPKRASMVDVEAVGDRTPSVVERALYPTPTEEEARVLRKVTDSIPITAYMLCIVEFSERASYYGVQGIFSNFMQFPLPQGGNGAGAPRRGTEETPGALGRGEQFSVSLGLLFLFLAYIIPIFGGWLADTQFGRYKTIFLGVLVCGFSHVIMICSAIPSVLQAGHAIGPFMVSFFLLAIGAGLFKPNIAPTVLDQYKHQRPYVRVLGSGEKVVVDPESTIQRIMLLFYGLVNVGAFYTVATTFSEKYVGYWLAFLTPGVIYFMLPGLLWYLNNKIVKASPTGSALSNVWRVSTTALKRNKFAIWKSNFWDAAKPSTLAQAGVSTIGGKPVSWTDKDVDDVRRTTAACVIFLYFPIWNLNDGGVGSVATSQAASMTTAGAPNDLIGNLNPLAIIITIPILSYIIYPALRKRNIKFGRISRITLGFTLATISGIIGAIVQWQIYKTSPCGYYASTCEVGTGVSPISVWVQAPNTILGAISECFCNVTAYELAYARSPQGMKAFVTALFLATTALSYALGEILIPAIVDPYLIWVWAGPTIALALQTVIFWYRYKDLNDDDFMTYEEKPLLDEKAHQSSVDGAREVAVPETIGEEDEGPKGEQAEKDVEKL